MKLSMKLVYQYMTIFFNFSLISSHLHPLQAENCDSNSRLVVYEDDNSKFGLERVNHVIYEYCLTSLFAQSWQYRDRRKPEAGTVPYSYFERLQGFFRVLSTIGSTVHSRPLNSSEHC